jgi:hypothetical protein
VQTTESERGERGRERGRREKRGREREREQLKYFNNGCCFFKACTVN